MKFEGCFNAKDFFGDYKGGLYHFAECLTSTDYDLDSCFADGIAFVLTDGFEHDEDLVWDFLAESKTVELVADTMCNNLTMADILKNWNEYLDEVRSEKLSNLISVVNDSKGESLSILISAVEKDPAYRENEDLEVVQDLTKIINIIRGTLKQKGKA